MDIQKLIEELDIALGTQAEPDAAVESALRDSLSEEEAAISAYVKRAEECESRGIEMLAKLYRELAEDEKVHAASLKQALLELGFDNAQLEIEGAEEYVDITNGEE